MKHLISSMVKLTKWELINMNKFKVLLIGLFILLGAFLTINFLTINSGFSEQYKANLTTAELEELRLTELCYIMESDFTIQALEEFCDERYGSIDRFYGDKIK